jgi:hypothetical protein
VAASVGLSGPDRVTRKIPVAAAIATTTAMAARRVTFRGRAPTGAAAGGKPAGAAGTNCRGAPATANALPAGTASFRGPPLDGSAAIAAALESGPAARPGAMMLCGAFTGPAARASGAGFAGACLRIGMIAKAAVSNSWACATSAGRAPGSSAHMASSHWFHRASDPSPTLGRGRPSVGIGAPLSNSNRHAPNA